VSIEPPKGGSFRFVQTIEVRMQRQQQEFRRGAEAYVRVVLRNLIYFRALADGYSGVRAILAIERHERIGFKSVSDLQSWLIDMENVQKSVNAVTLRCAECGSDFKGTPICPSCRSTVCRRIAGFDYFGLVGDHLACGISFEKMASTRRLSIAGIKDLYWEGLGKIFTQLLERDVTAEYAEKRDRACATCQCCGAVVNGTRCEPCDRKNVGAAA
jgi:hypothetical protein